MLTYNWRVEWLLTADFKRIPITVSHWIAYEFHSMHIVATRAHTHTARMHIECALIDRYKYIHTFEISLECEKASKCWFAAYIYMCFCASEHHLTSPNYIIYCCDWTILMMIVDGAGFSYLSVRLCTRIYASNIVHIFYRVCSTKAKAIKSIWKKSIHFASKCLHFHNGGRPNWRLASMFEIQCACGPVLAQLVVPARRRHGLTQAQVIQRRRRHHVKLCKNTKTHTHRERRNNETLDAHLASAEMHLCRNAVREDESKMHETRLTMLGRVKWHNKWMHKTAMAQPKTTITNSILCLSVMCECLANRTENICAPLSFRKSSRNNYLYIMWMWVYSVFGSLQIAHNRTIYK